MLTQTSSGVAKVVGNYDILVGALGFVLGTYLLLSHRNRVANRFLAFLVFAFSWMVVYQGLEMLGHLERFRWLERTDDALPFVVGPLLYLYVRTLVRERSPSFRHDLPHLVPFLVYVLYLVPWYLSDPTVRPLAEEVTLERAVVTLLKLLSVSSYAVGAVRVFRRHEQRIRRSFSNLHRVSLEWLKASGLAFAVMVGVVIVMYLLQGSGLPVGPYIDPTVYTLATLWIIATGAFSMTQPEIDVSEPDGVPPFQGEPDLHGAEGTDDGPEQAEAGESLQKYRKTLLSEEACAAYLERLLHFMTAGKPYLESELTIGDVSARVGIPTHHLSQVINAHLSKNFYDFVNGYRVEEAKRLLAKPPPHATKILAVALESGFTSKSTFNQVFKRVTGLTPSQYRSSQMP